MKTAKTKSGRTNKPRKETRKATPPSLPNNQKRPIHKTLVVLAMLAKAGDVMFATQEEKAAWKEGIFNHGLSNFPEAAANYAAILGDGRESAE